MFAHVGAVIPRTVAGRLRETSSRRASVAKFRLGILPVRETIFAIGVSPRGIWDTCACGSTCLHGFGF